MLAQIGGRLAHFCIELNVQLFALAEDDRVLQMEMDQNQHLIVARLIEGVFDVGVENIDLVSTHRCITKPVRVRLEHSIDFLIGQVGSNVEIFQLGIDFAWIENQGVLFDYALRTREESFLWNEREQLDRPPSVFFLALDL